MQNRKTIYNALPIVAAHYGEQFGVKVVVGGSEAATDGKTVFIPNVSDSFPDHNIVWGYLGHEAAHIRFTNFEIFGSIPANQSIRRALLNVIEDVRIEKAMAEKFPGTYSDLVSTATYVRDSGMFPRVKPTDHPAEVLVQKVLQWSRTNILGQPLEEYEKLAEIAMQEIFSQGVNTRLAVMLRKVVTAQSTQDCLTITDSILTMLKDEAEKQPDNQDGNDSGSDSGQQDSKAGDPGQDGNNQNDQPISSDDSSADAGDSKKDGSDQDKDTSSDAGDSQSQEGDSSDSDATDASTSSLESSGSTNQSDQSNVNENITKALEASDIDITKDVMEQLKSEMCKEAIQNGDNTYCSVPDAPYAKGNNGKGQNLLRTVLANSSKVRSQLMGLIQAANRSGSSLRRRGKRIDSRRVTRLLSGDTRFFISREEKIAVNTSIHILTDLSSSMRSHQALVAQEASLSIALALEPVPGVDVAVSYFMGTANDPVRKVLKNGERARINADRFTESSRGYTPMAEAIWHAAFELSKTKSNRRIIIVITDGKPDNANSTKTVLELCDKSSIETVAIGISSTSVKDFFANYSVIENVDELPKTLFNLVKNKLVNVA